MQRCSRYEWFLSDAIRKHLQETGRNFRIKEQYKILDHRGFYWYWDLFVWIEGKSLFNGYGELIDVQGPQHSKQKKYSGPGGGYTRDYDKEWEVRQQRLHKQGIETRYINNDECKLRIVDHSAKEIVNELIKRADTWC
jgi:hypothetical protein